MVPRLLERYRNEIIPAMMQTFSLKNKMAVPRLEKIVVNMGVGEGIQDIKMLEKSMDEMGMITGQKPIMRRAKKAIANFKIKQGSPVGCKVTLRRAIMYEFLDRLVNVALPRIRDFRGVSDDAFDASGNYTLGLKEQVVFPELDYDKVEKVRGLEVSIGTTAKTDDEARQLLELLGMPFVRD